MYYEIISTESSPDIQEMGTIQAPPWFLPCLYTSQHSNERLHPPWLWAPAHAGGRNYLSVVQLNVGAFSSPLFAREGGFSCQTLPCCGPSPVMVEHNLMVALGRSSSASKTTCWVSVSATPTILLPLPSKFSVSMELGNAFTSKLTYALNDCRTPSRACSDKCKISREPISSQSS